MSNQIGTQPSAISHQRAPIAGLLVALGLTCLTPALSGPGAVLSIPGTLQAQETGLPVGSKAPTSTLVETLDGKPFDLGQYVGTTPVLIQFWATWCPNCKQLEPAMEAASKKYAGKIKFVAIAVSVNQSVERVKLYAAKHGMPGEVYFDRKGNAADSYDAAATSYIVVLDKNGSVVYTGLGGTQNVDAAVRKGIGG
jgi:thiol-disulfide isomerase/thioredoxin